jgi:hypothetical protein
MFRQLLLLGTLGLSALALPARAQQSASAQACLTAGGNTEIRACLERREHESEDLLSRSEADFLITVQKSSLASSDRTAIAKSFGASSGPFRIYRSRQCDLQALVAAGGRAAPHRRFECLIALNEERLDHIRELKAQIK